MEYVNLIYVIFISLFWYFASVSYKIYTFDV